MPHQKSLVCRMFFGGAGLVLLAGLWSCKLQNQIVLEGVGRGSLALSLEVPGYMLQNMDLIAQSFPGGAELLQPENIAAELQKTKDISAVTVNSAKRGAYDIRFGFQNLGGLGGSQQQFLTWRQQADGSTRLSIVLSRDSYGQLEQRFPLLKDNTLLQLYGPASTEGMSRTDYLDMIEYSFGAKARRDLPAAQAEIAIQVPGKVLQQTGGTQKDPRTVEFRLPLLDLVLLPGSKSYSIVYR